jgi:hypothetical protein
MKTVLWLIVAASIPSLAHSQALVTERTLSLDAAREAIRQDWRGAYRQFVEGRPSDQGSTRLTASSQD